MYQLIHKADLPTKNWAGGTTTQCFIYPPESTYEERNFLFRLSTATVNADGPFSKLEGVSRVITVLKGSMSICHDGALSELFLDINTPPYSFDGGADTMGRVHEGPVIDYNLMMRKGVTGKLDSLEISNPTSYSLSRHADVLSFYLHSGMVELDFLSEKVKLAEGDFFIFFSDGDAVEFKLNPQSECTIVSATIQL